MEHGSLFSGIDGFGLGFSRAGLETAWGVEIDPDAQRVFRHHNPGVLLLADVRECGAHNLPRVDVISFGSPCQDLSVAGKREGLGGERSGLFHEAIRIVRELRPTFAIWENVPGALSSYSGPAPADGDVVLGRGWETSEESDFARALWELLECGPRDLCWRVLDAQYFGVPQRRRRVFAVADFGGERAGQILFESPCGCRDFKKGRKKKPGIAPAVTPGARRASGQRAGEQLAVTLRSRESGPGVNPPGRGGEDDQNLVFQKTGAGAFRAGKPTLAAGDDNGDNQVVYQCHGNNVGPMGTVRQGNGGLTGGVPFTVQATFAEGQGPHAREADVAKCLDGHGGNPDSQQGGTLIGFNIVGLGQNSKNHAYETDTSGCLQSKGLSASGNEAGTLIAHTLRAEGHDASEDGTGRGTPLVAFKESQSGTRMGDVHSTLDSNKGSRRQEGVIEGMCVRRLTPLECLRLMGLPDDWLDLDPPLSDSAKYRLIGNSVAVPVVEWIGRRLKRAVE